MGFPGGSDGREYVCSAEDLGSVPGMGGSPGEGNGYPLQYSCLESAMDRGAWQAKNPWGHKQLDTAEQLILLLFLTYELKKLQIITLAEKTRKLHPHGRHHLYGDALSKLTSDERV